MQAQRLRRRKEPTLEQRNARMPLRYNYDKPEKPRRIKGFEVFSLVFSSFSKPKNHTEIGGHIKRSCCRDNFSLSSLFIPPVMNARQTGCYLHYSGLSFLCQ